MSDIVEQLRKGIEIKDIGKDVVSMFIHPEVCDVAADEIERLREALKECKGALEWDSTYHDGEKWQYIIDGDKANIARAAAKAALEGK